MVLGNFAAGRAIRALARSNPVRSLLGLLLRSLSVRHSAAATRSRALLARSLRRPPGEDGRLEVLPSRHRALRLSQRIPPIKHIWRAS
jgi:hypothetical protein